MTTQIIINAKNVEAIRRTNANGYDVITSVPSEIRAAVATHNTTLEPISCYVYAHVFRDKSSGQTITLYLEREWALFVERSYHIEDETTGAGTPDIQSGLAKVNYLLTHPIELETITRVYSGKPGCGCGCNGTYWEDQRNIRRVVKRMNLNRDSKVDGPTCFSLYDLGKPTENVIWSNETDTRYYWAYTREPKGNLTSPASTLVEIPSAASPAEPEMVEAASLVPEIRPSNGTPADRPGCECGDPGCSICKGECDNEATITLYRCDMTDETGTQFCGGFGEDAMSSGCFTSEDEPDNEDNKSASPAGDDDRAGWPTGAALEASAEFIKQAYLKLVDATLDENKDADYARNEFGMLVNDELESILENGEFFTRETPVVASPELKALFNQIMDEGDALEARAQAQDIADGLPVGNGDWDGMPSSRFRMEKLRHGDGPVESIVHAMTPGDTRDNACENEGGAMTAHLDLVTCADCKKQIKQHPAIFKALEDAVRS